MDKLKIEQLKAFLQELQESGQLDPTTGKMELTDKLDDATALRIFERAQSRLRDVSHVIPPERKTSPECPTTPQSEGERNNREPTSSTALPGHSFAELVTETEPTIAPSPDSIPNPTPMGRQTTFRLDARALLVSSALAATLLVAILMSALSPTPSPLQPPVMVDGPMCESKGEDYAKVDHLIWGTSSSQAHSHPGVITIYGKRRLSVDGSKLSTDIRILKQKPERLFIETKVRPREVLSQLPSPLVCFAFFDHEGNCLFFDFLVLHKEEDDGEWFGQATILLSHLREQLKPTLDVPEKARRGAFRLGFVNLDSLGPDELPALKAAKKRDQAAGLDVDPWNPIISKVSDR